MSSEPMPAGRDDSTELLPTTIEPRTPPGEAGPEPVPTIPGYRIVRRLGAGGMGIVYEAEQESPRRRVALKVIRGGTLADPVRVKMFQRETEALARLKHSNIGAIYEAGQTADGRPYFAMELLSGPTLSDHLAGAPRSRADIRQRLELFRTLCDAVHYAHQKGIIHRDLKPANIVVAREAGDDRLKILDFGLARVTDTDAPNPSLMTEVGVIKGTLAYMSPEQARGGGAAIDTRADVYALGMILYEMMTGRRPYDIENGSLVEALRIICEQPHPPMSRGAAVPIDADVETIVSKALEKEPDRRYASAAGLGGDVQRYLTSRPILARPPSAIYQLRKFAARNTALILGVAATLFVLIAGIIVASVLGLREARQRREADRAGYVASVIAAEAGLRLFEVAEVKRRLEACPIPLRGWEWRHLSHRADLSDRVLTGPTARIYPVAVSPDGKLIVAGGVDPDNRIFFWDAATGELIRAIQGGSPTTQLQAGGVRSLAFSSDGTRIASASDDKAVRVWEVATGRKLLDLVGHESRVNAVAWTPDDRELVSASYDRTVRRWDAATGQSLGIVGRHESQAYAVAVCDGSRIASGGGDRTLRVWELPTGREVIAFRAPNLIVGVACSPAGDRIAVGSADGSVILVDARTGSSLGPTMRHDDVVNSVAFSPDGRRLASSSKDRTVRLWDAVTGSPLGILLGHVNNVISVTFDATGDRLISGSWDRTVRAWTPSPAQLSPILGSETGGIHSLQQSPDGRRIITGSRQSGIRMWDTASGAEVAAIPNAAAPLVALHLSSDGRLLAGGYADETKRAWELAADDRITLLREERLDGTGLGPFIPGSSEVFLDNDETKALSRWDIRSGERSAEVATPMTRLWSLAPNPDGTRYALAGALDLYQGLLQIREARSGQILAENRFSHFDPNARIGNPALGMAWSPDGMRLASVHGQDFTVRLWDGTTLAPLATMHGHTEIVRAAAFSPDGSRLATGADDYTVRLWDAINGEPLLALRSGDQSSVGGLLFSPDGATIVSTHRLGFGSGPSTIRLWRTRF